ncbi:MAG TPA: glycosyltransferase family 2 protein [Gaiellaceae bacterium]|nr:glycosyltransferase family 2 protein [Gaiellaceae bacterium]
MRAVVVIPTLNACALLAEALASIDAQTVPVDVIVVDNASSDGTLELLATRFPRVTVVRNEENLGFGRAVNQGAAAAADADAIILVNNDAVCAPDFVARLLAPFADPAVGMVAGVLLQGAAPELIDSAGIELDTTLGSWDYLWNQPVGALDDAHDPVGPCGGAAAYRLPAFRKLGGFDETLFAYWEDVDLALRFREAGWRCVLASGARALHRHGQTLGAASPAARRLEAFGRGYVLAKYRAGGRSPIRRLQIAALDWPVLVVHLVLRREVGPARERLRARSVGLRGPRRRAPLELATVGFGTALRRQAELLRLRFAGTLPAHFRSDTADGPP